MLSCYSVLESLVDWHDFLGNCKPQLYFLYKQMVLTIKPSTSIFIEIGNNFHIETIISVLFVLICPYRDPWKKKSFDVHLLKKIRDLQMKYTNKRTLGNLLDTFQHSQRSLSFRRV